MGEQIVYMGHHWISIEDGVVTVGLTEDAVADLTEEVTINLPEQDDIVAGGKVCGDIESDNGNLNIYSPVAGTILEVNEAVLENPELLQEDPTDEGWLFKVEADDPDKLDRLTVRATNHDEEDEDDDEDDDEDEDDESEDGDGESSDE